MGDNTLRKLIVVLVAIWLFGECRKIAKEQGVDFPKDLFKEAEAWIKNQLGYES